MRSLDAAAVRDLLPHAPPFLFVDTVSELIPGERVTAAWAVPEQAFWTDAHFPGQPVLPGVLLAEALAQAAALVYLSQDDAEGLPVLVGADGLRFRAAVAPGDALTLRATTTHTRRLWRFDVVALRGETVVADGTLIASLART